MKNTISLEELSEKSKNNLEWLWESVEKDIGIVWDMPYTKTLDNNGILGKMVLIENKSL